MGFGAAAGGIRRELRGLLEELAHKALDLFDLYFSCLKGIQRDGRKVI